MTVAQEWAESRVCAQCGKDICVLYPHLWRFKRQADRGNAQLYFCSWRCFRKDEDERKNKEMDKKKMNHQEAIQAALDGGDPIECLREQGSKAPDKLWSYIKGQLLKKDPETYEKLAKTKKIAGMQEAETPEGEYTRVKLSGPIRIETETPEKVLVEQKLKAAVIGKPETAGPIKRMKRYTVSAIRYPEMGEFYYDKNHNAIYWRTPEGEEVSMSPTGWRLLHQDLPEIFETLGV